jgi:hypothetical protein
MPPPSPVGLASIIKTHHQKQIRETSDQNINLATKEFLETIQCTLLTNQTTIDSKLTTKITELQISIQEITD